MKNKLFILTLGALLLASAGHVMAMEKQVTDGAAASDADTELEEALKVGQRILARTEQISQRLNRIRCNNTKMQGDLGLGLDEVKKLQSEISKILTKKALESEYISLLTLIPSSMLKYDALPKYKYEEILRRQAEYELLKKKFQNNINKYKQFIESQRTAREEEEGENEEKESVEEEEESGESDSE